MEKMKAIVFKGVRDVELQEFPIPIPSRGRVLVRIKASAICTWEQRVYSGIKKIDFPFVGGHEMSGVIEALGDDVDGNRWKVGDRVVIGVTLPCGACYPCKSGNEQNCEHFMHTRPIDGLPYLGMGGFSSHFCVPTANLFKFDGVSFEEATIAEPLSCVVHSVESGNLSLGENVLVAGCGIMGLLHVQLAVKKGAAVIAMDPNEERLKMAVKMGARAVINPEQEDVKDRVIELCGGKLNCIFDTTPIAQLVEELIGCLANNGRLILYSSFYPDKPVSFSPDWLHKSGAALIGTANSNSVDFTKATRLLSQGIINVSELVSEVYDAADAAKALESAARGDKYRVLVRF